MKTALPLKSRSHQLQITQITDIITNIAKDQIAFVILFGSFARGDWVYDRYIENGTTYEYASDYDILIITKTKKQASLRNATDLENKIEKEIVAQNLDQKHNVTLVVESLQKVNSELEKDHYFFSDIKKEGIILYSDGGYKLSKPKKLSSFERKAIALEDYEHWFGKAEEFLIDCRNAFDRGSYVNSVFYLHQATESLYHCNLLVLTGYKRKTHDLVKLQKLCSAYSNQFLTVFLKATDEEKECFKLLKVAYIDARYNKEYKISKEQLEYLIKRAKILQKITSEICLGKIESFDIV